MNSTFYELTPTDLKFNDVYILWYSNIARLLVTGVFPLGSLAYLNSLIYSVVSSQKTSRGQLTILIMNLILKIQIRRRRRMTNRPSTTNAVSAAQKAEETRQAILLFAIVILFVCCHSLRILLNVNELLTLKVVRSSIKNGCFGVPFWALVGVPVSHFLITFNSSVNFFIYCFMCTTFRRILLANIKKVKNHILKRRGKVLLFLCDFQTL